MRQCFIIITISFLGEMLNLLIPLPIPASIYGLLLLFVGLETGIVKLSAVKETARFLIDMIPLMFIPAGVGLLESWGVLKPILLPLTVILVVSTVLVMVVSGRVTQRIIRGKQCKEDAKSE